jgi:hypothetical protein
VIAALVAVVAMAAVGIAIAATSDGAGDRADATGSPARTSSPEALVPTPPATPSDLDARTKPFAVKLRWAPDTSAGQIEGYTLYRNGFEVGTVMGDGPGRFVDDEVLPLVRYQYAVAAFGQDGVASEPVEVRVKTPAASLAEARLEGTFNVKIHVVSSFGYTSGGGGSTGGWTFTPKCKRGACGVKVSRVFRGSAGVTMERRSATYRAQGSGRLGVRCGGTPSTSTYTIQLRVVKADTVDGEWHAVAVGGSLVHREAAQLGCVAGGANLALSARLIDL